MQNFIDLLKGVEDQHGLSMYQILTDPSLEGLVELAMAERGFNERADVLYQTLDGADLNEIFREFEETLRLRQSWREPLINALTFQVTTPIEQVFYPSEEDFEEASEYGQPKGLRMGTPWNMGYGFKWYDLAIRYTWMFLAEASQAQVEALHNQALDADNRLLFNKVLQTVFNPLNGVSSIRNIPVTTYKFWNGDGIAPPVYKTYTHTGSHNHYITSGASTLQTAGLLAIEDHLYHHGYSVFNGYRLVLLVNRQEGKVIRGARVTGGWEYDFIPSNNVGGGIILPASAGIVGRPDEGALQGLSNVIGTYGPFAVIEEDYVPAGYVACLASNGPGMDGLGALGNPVGIREHANDSLRGLKLVGGSNDDYPIIDSFYRHGFGTGIRHRGGGVVMQVTTSGTYTVPSQYA